MTFCLLRTRNSLSKVFFAIGWINFFLALIYMSKVLQPANVVSSESPLTSLVVEGKPLTVEKHDDAPLRVPQQPAGEVKVQNLETRPFDPESPKLVILLAYQRVGSTFIGEMFNKNPNASYIYEPLDASYMRMYGTKDGYAVPMDLHYFWNGTYRPVPSEEQELVTKDLENILTCNYENTISEFLLHRFWKGFAKLQTTYFPYSSCLKDKSNVSLAKCHEKLGESCKARLGQSVHMQQQCFEQLVHESTEKPFRDYKSCVAMSRTAIKKDCLPTLQNICDSKKIRAIKTVRLDMETIENLVEKHPNLRIIHLIRDPRPVVLSRMKTLWATLGSTDLKHSRDLIKNKQPSKVDKKRPRLGGKRSLLSLETNNTSDESVDFEKELEKEIEKAEKPPNDFVREAKLYCELVLRDMRVRQRIESKHKGTTYQMIYEHMVHHPQHEVERVYQFLDEPVPGSVVKWTSVINKGTKSKDIAQKWQDQMTVKMAKQIDSFCSDLYEEIDFAWPDSE